MKCPVVVLPLVFLFPFPILAAQTQDTDNPARLGTVHFPVSCSPSVQQRFERGVAQLHSFSYEGAEITFVQVAKDDPYCAIAHWGIVMSQWHQGWNLPDAATIERGRAELEEAEALQSSTERERRYIAALEVFFTKSVGQEYRTRANAYSNAMEGIYHDYPDDHEAAAFYALSLIFSQPQPLANRKAAADILENLFLAEPNHPGAGHYLIHCYDTPELAQLGLIAARQYSKIAPSAPHALHMPSHIFARLGLWQEDIKSNLDSIAAARDSGTMHMGDEDQQFHAIDFLAYAYLQSGRESEVRRLIQEVETLPATKDMYGIGYDPRISAVIGLSASYALELHQWSEAASLTPIPVKVGAEESITYWARAIGAARSGHLAEARKDIGKIETIYKAVLGEKKADWAAAVDQDRNEASAWLAHAEGRDDEAFAILRPIADKQMGQFQASDGIPAREMLGDILMEIGRPKQALAEYETDLRVNPNRFDGLYGAAHAAELTGDAEKAVRYYSQLAKDCAGGNSHRPELSRAKSLILARNPGSE